MEDLEGGVSSLWLGLGDGRIPVESLPDVLAETYLDLAPIVLDAGERFAEAADVFLASRSGSEGAGRRAGRLSGRGPAGRPGADRCRGRCRCRGWGSPGRPCRRRSDRRRRPGPPLRGGLPRDPRDRGRRAALPRGRRHRRGGARLLPRRGPRVPAGDASGRALRRRGVRPARIPLRCHRRPVRDDRQAARRPPGLGPGRPAVRCYLRRRRSVAARGQLLVDADPPGPVEQHPARHPGLFLGRRRRCRRDHGRSLRRGDRAARPAGPPGRPQRPRPAGRGVPRGSGDRPGGRVLVRRGPHRAACGQGVGLVPGDRAVGRAARGAGRRARLRPAGGQPR